MESENTPDSEMEDLLPPETDEDGRKYIEALNRSGLPYDILYDSDGNICIPPPLDPWDYCRE